MKKKNRKLQIKKQVKKIEAPAVVHADADLWQDLTSRTKEKFLRVEQGKGDTPRPVDIDKYHNNYEDIDWHRDGNQTPDQS